MPNRETADLVVVGAGTIGGWASYFAKTDGVGRVVVLGAQPVQPRLPLRRGHRVAVQPGEILAPPGVRGNR